MKESKACQGLGHRRSLQTHDHRAATVGVGHLSAAIPWPRPVAAGGASLEGSLKRGARDLG
jgi:hypothetical protein